MPKYCCVPGCRNRGGHLFPTSEDELMKWRVAVKRLDPKTKRLWNPNLDHSVVCDDHFQAKDFELNKSRRILKQGSVPSIFPFRKPPTQRAKRVTYCKNDSRDPPVAVTNEVVISTTKSPDKLAAGNDSEKCFKSVMVQCQLLPKQAFRIANFMQEPKAILYFTGFEDYTQFSLFRDVMMFDINELEYRCTILSDEDQLFLALVKLRQSLDHQLISYMFNVSEATVSKVFSSWVNFMYTRLKMLPIWPSKKVIQETMPDHFKKLYPSTRVIIDSTEIPIEKPADIRAQQQTFSTYKNRNTVKVLIGITPKGAVSYVSDCFGGAASDRSIIEQADLLKYAGSLFEKGDSIMADKGFLVQDLFATFDVKINTPTLMRGKTHLSQDQRLNDVAISSQRVHVERVIGYAKTFKLIQGVVPYNLLPLINKIVFVCFLLVNFRRPIVF